MIRPGKLLAYIVGGIAVIVVVAAVGLVAFDWNRMLPWLNQRLSQAAGRPVEIDGPLTLSWRIPAFSHSSTDDADAAASDTLSDYVPVLHISVQHLKVGNPAWAHTPEFATLDGMQFDLRLLPLLVHRVVVPALSLQNPSIDLERLADGTQNWLFKVQGESGGTGWQLALGRIEFPAGKISVNDAMTSARLQIGVDTLGQAIPFEDTLAKFHASDAAASAANGTSDTGSTGSSGASATQAQSPPPARRPVPPYAIGLTVAGTYKGAALKGNAKLGSILALDDPNRPFPIQAQMQFGESHINVAGTLTDPVHLAAVDMRLQLSGSSLANLYPLTGANLPSTPPYSIDGRLTGNFNTGATRLSYRDFTGRVGGSDLSGSLVYQQKQPRPLLTGSLVSNLLQFSDLAPLVGADSNASKANRGDSFRQPDDRALPAEPFKTDRWNALDVDLNFTGKRIVRTANLPIENVSTHVRMDNGKLTLDPLKFGVAGGTLDSSWIFDGSSVPLKAQLKVEVRHLKLKQLFPSAAAVQTSLGEMNGDGALTAVGNSMAALAAASNGEVKLIVTDGTISSTLLEEAGLNVANIVVAKLFGQKDVRINCGASDFIATDGVWDSRFFALDTDDAIITTTGKINLKNEQMDLDVRPRTKGFRIISLRSPLYVKGTFKKPDVGVNAMSLAVRGGVAIGLGLIAPPAALLALLSPSHNVDLPCTKILGQLDKPSQAPPAGQREKARPALDATPDDAEHAASKTAFGTEERVPSSGVRGDASAQRAPESAKAEQYKH